MKMIQSFDPSAAMSGTFDPQIANPCGRIYLFNESAIGIQLSFQDGSNASLPPFYFRSYKVAKSGIVTWTRIYTIASGASPLSVVIGESYESQEARSVTFTEGPLNRQTSIGNTVPVSGNVTQLINDGNPVQTLVEATPSGDPGSAVQLSTAGVLILGNATHHGSISSDNGAFRTDGAGNLVAVHNVSAAAINATGAISTTSTVSSTGAISTMNNLSVMGSSSLDNGNITTDGVGDMTVGGVLTASSTLHAGHLLLGTGGLLAIARFGPYTVGNTSTAFNHNLGVTPDIVLCCLQGTAGTLHSIKVDDTSYTSSQFHAVADTAGVSFIGIALKF